MNWIVKMFYNLYIVYNDRSTHDKKKLKNK